jgi:hypothetical protein
VNTTIIRADQLEGRFERLLVDFGNLQQQVAGLINQIQALQGGNQQPQGVGSGLIFSMVGVVIGAGGSVTGATVNALVGGSTVAFSTNATVYNQMQAATVVTNTIMLGQNPDGTFSAISQSC